jgi:hypothetical protein
LAPEDTAIVANADPPIPGSFPVRHPTGFHTLDGLLDTIVNLTVDDSLKAKPFESPCRSVSPLSISHTEADEERSSSSSSLSQSPQAQQQAMTKRHHALQELLSSERAYASDLALICDVHIPLALGHDGVLSKSSRDSSASSSRTQSTASDISQMGHGGPPMVPEDIKIIFSNVQELALFSESLTDKMEKAMGSGEDDDHIGALFLSMTTEFEAPYKYYITRHPAALAHLQNLPQTPALTSYLSRTQSVASAVSHAWDLSSLLIKPVQRLLKYPLLLLAIYEDTPNGHPDKENLDRARKKMEEVARNVNEGRRRAEVVKEVLSSKKKPLSSAVKIKTLRVGTSKLPVAADGENGEAAKVEKMFIELKRIDGFAQQFARNVLEWSRSTSHVLVALRMWAISFGKVIGLSAEQGSEAFEAFLAVVEDQLMPLCFSLDSTVNDKLLKDTAHLLNTMTQPFKLIESMYDQEPLHHHLLTMNLSNRRPPSHLVEASNNYRALRDQLAAELPDYIHLLQRGLKALVARLTDIQTEFWKAVRDRWGELWDMLRVDGEMNAGYEETIKVWKLRWAEVADIVASINITQRRKLYTETVVRWRNSTPSNVVNVLATLEPSPSLNRGRPRGASDASARIPKQRAPGRKASNESLRPVSTKQPKPPRRKTDDFTDFMFAPSVAQQLLEEGNSLPRTKSMPLPTGTPVLCKSQPSSRIAATSFASADSDQTLRCVENGMPEHPKHKHDHHRHQRDDRHAHDHDADRGRSSRKSSLKRKQEHDKKSTERGEAEGYKDRHGKRPNSAKRSSFKTIASLFNSGFSPAPSDAASISDESWLNVSNHEVRALTQSQRDSWLNKDAKYVCRVIHACIPPASVSYFSFPFFTLVEDDMYEVLQEAGHPSMHPKLPLYVDDGEDCLLLCRDAQQNVGWALASFLEPLDSAVPSHHRR